MLCLRKPFFGTAITVMIIAVGSAQAQNTPTPPQAASSWEQLQDGLSQRLWQPQKTPPAPAGTPKVVKAPKPEAQARSAPEGKKAESKESAQPKQAARPILPAQPTKSRVLNSGQPLQAKPRVVTAKPLPKQKTPQIVKAAPKSVPTFKPQSKPLPPAEPITVIAQPAPRPPAVAPSLNRPPTDWDRAQDRISNLPVVSPETAKASINPAPKPASKPAPKITAKPPVQPATNEPKAQTARVTPTPVPETVEPAAAVKEAGVVDGIISRITSIFTTEQDTPAPAPEPAVTPPVAVTTAPTTNGEIESAGKEATAASPAITTSAENGFLKRAAGAFAKFFKPTVEATKDTPLGQASDQPGKGNADPRQKNGQIAAILPPSSQKPGTRVGGKPLQGVKLQIGLDQKFRAAKPGNFDKNPNCFSKGPNKSWYCVDNTEWPEAFKEQVEVGTWLYRNGRTIVQFDDNRLTRMYTLFPSRNLKAIVAHFEERFGPATEYRIADLPVIGGPADSNPSWRWLSVSSDKKTTMVLEIREFDDERRMIPDRTVGFIRLFEQGSTPIFRYLSETDLMLHQTRPAKRRLRK